MTDNIILIMSSVLILGIVFIGLGLILVKEESKKDDGINLKTKTLEEFLEEEFKSPELKEKYEKALITERKRLEKRKATIKKR